MNHPKRGCCCASCLSSTRFSTVVAVLLCLPMMLVQACSEKAPERAKPQVPVTTAIAIEKDVPVQISANGTVEASAIVNITSRVDGQVMQVYLKQGQEVEKGQLLFAIDDRPYRALLESAQSNLTRDRIRLEQAQKDAQRYSDLIKKDYVTRSQYEQTLTDAQSLAAVVKGDEAALDNARLNLAYCRIVAPIGGRAGSILIDPGNLVKANDSKPLMVIHRVKPIFVRFSVPEQYLTEIQKQMGIEELKVYVSTPAKSGAPREGRLTFMDNTVDPTTGTIDLKATVANQDDSLWPGQFVNIVLVLGLRPHAVLVPSQAIQMGQQGHFIFVVGKDMTVESRDVTPGAQIDGQTVIEKGLTAGEEVVRDGQLRLYPGAKVVLKNEHPAGGDSRP